MKYIPTFLHKWICPICGGKNTTLRRRTSIGRKVFTRCPSCGRKNVRISIEETARPAPIEILEEKPKPVTKLCKDCGVRFECPTEMVYPTRNHPRAKVKYCSKCMEHHQRFRPNKNNTVGCKSKLERMLE